MKVLDFLEAPLREEARLFLFSGTEPYLRQQAVEHVLAGHGADVEVVRLTGASDQGREPVALSDLLDELRTQSLFGSDRVVHLVDADDLVRSHGKALERFIAAGEALHPWIIEGEAVAPKKLKGPPKTGLAGAVARAGGLVVSCQPLYATSFGGRGPVYKSPLSSWVRHRAGRLGKRMGLEDAYELHRLVGTDLRTLDAELRKLVLFVGERPAITRRDVEQAAAGGGMAPAYELGDAVAAGNLRLALAKAAQLFERGVADAGGRVVRDPASVALILLRTVASRLQRVLRASEMMRGGASFEEAAAAVNQPPWGRDRLRQQVAASGAAGPRLVSGLRELESGLKQGGGAPRVLFERFLVETLGRPAPQGSTRWR